MPTSIDSLQIELTAESQKANNTIDKLVGKLDLLSKKLNFDTSSLKELGNINGDNLNKVGLGIESLSRGISALNGVKKTSYNTIASGIERFGKIDSGNLETIGKALVPLANGVSLLSNVDFNNKSLQNLINSITRLSNANIQSLQNVNFADIGNSINSLANSLATAPKVQQSVISLTNAIANLAKSGRDIPIVSANLGALGDALKKFINSMSNVSSVADNTIAFSQAIASIASAGNKTATTASNLSQLAVALRDFMNTMSTAKSVNASVIQMTNALANLANQGGRVSTASRGLVSGLNNTNKSMIRTMTSSFSLAAAFGRLYANYFLVIRGAKAFVNAIKGTSDYIEAFNYYNVAFGKIADEWDKDWEKYGYNNSEAYADSFTQRMQESLSKMSGLEVVIDADGKGMLTSTNLQNLGLNIQEITQYASQLASVTNSVGQTGEVSLAAARSFSKLGADISSLFNIDYSDAMANLQSGLIGQSRALYKYGIDITNATLQTYAFELGLSKSVSEMTQAEKMQLRMVAILEQSRVAWGDLANTINSPSNMLRQFTNNLNEVGMVLGQLFIPLMERVMPVVNGATIAIKNFLVNIASLLGIQIDFSAFGEGFNQVGEEAEDLSDGLNDLTDSAKRTNKQLGKFDELNNITLPSASSKGIGLGASIDLTEEIVKATEEYEKVWNEAFDKMQQKSQDWANKISGIFSQMATSAEPFTTAISELLNGGLKGFASFTWDGLKGFYENFLVPIGEWFFGEEDSGLTRLVNIINEGFEKIDWDSLNQSLEDFWKAIEPYAEEFGEGLIDFFSGISGIAIDIVNKIPDFLYALTEALENGDPEDARKWGENLLILLVGIKGFSIASKAAVGITTVAGALKKITSIKDSAKLATLGKNLKGIGTALKGFGATASGALSSLGGIGGIFTTDLATIFGAGTVAEIGLTVATGLVGAIAAAIGGWNIGQILYEWITGEEIDMKWTEQFSKIFESFTDGSWKSALDLWGQDIASAFKTAGEEIGKWYDDNVSPTLENAGKTITEFGKTYISEPFKLWGEDIEKWWDEDVSPWFTKDKWNELGQNVKEGISKKWSEFTDWWTNTGFYKWWTEEVSSYFDKEKWSWSGIKDGLSQAFENAIASVKQIWNSFAEWLNSKLVFEWKAVTIKGIELFPSGKIDLGKLPTFATGGFPEDGLFMANRGELVGQFSNGRTAVANNEQIVAGIEGGVERAVARVLAPYLADIAESSRITANKEFGITEQQIFEANRNQAEDFKKRTGELAFG